MKRRIPLFLLLFAFSSMSCSEDTINNTETQVKASEATKQKTDFVEDYSELYYMHGIQISKRFCYLAQPTVCEEGEVVDSDTLNTAFLVRVTFNSENPDSVLFDGLEGVNTTPREMISNGFNGGSAAYLNCTSPSSDCGYARKTGTDLEFNILSPGGHYMGTGTLENDLLTIQADYNYRGSGSEYILEGQKIVEEK